MLNVPPTMAYRTSTVSRTIWTPGDVPTELSTLTQIEEMLIARVHVYVEIQQIRGQQYRYSGSVLSCQLSSQDQCSL